MKRIVLLACVLVASLVASTAQANVWERAIDSDKPARMAEDKYDSEMRQGDEHTMLANVKNAGASEVKRQIQIAISAYKAAAAAKPTEGEPYFRIGKLLYSFYFDCGDRWSSQQAAITCKANVFDKDRALEVIAAWDAFEARAPLDPRLSVGPFGGAAGDDEILFDRAILHTRLATKKHLQAAAADYEKILTRFDGDNAATSRVLGNLAETYMMLGRMEESLETYREALRNSSDTSTWYGYAVALDRDESTRQALEIIRSLGRDQRDAFYASVTMIGGGTFFVPEGEKYYYFALADEAFGLEEEAIDNWQRFIRSGAHPEFHHRAKAHLDALSVKKKRRSIPIEPPWPELFR
jgi:tetratricopeptide (TPR) repeat protein